nr:hypothetical protein [Candidatus Sigynarchaeota archaeon]
MVSKSYFCTVCKTQHKLDLPADLAKGRDAYPFSHVFLHKVEKSTNIEEIGTDILTTLYIDANLSIRGVEVKKLVGGDIISKDDSKAIISELMEEIGRLQGELYQLQEKYRDLKEKHDLLSKGDGSS